jgi:hypothetical protein
VSRWLEREPVIPEICAALNQERAQYLVIGGIAGVLHGHVRVATDIDLLIARTRDNATRVLLALAASGYGYASEWLPAEILKRAVTVIGDDPSVNLCTAMGTLRFEEAAGRAATVEAGGVQIPVLSLQDLIASKRTNRPLDAADLAALEQIRRLEPR